MGLYFAPEAHSERSKSFAVSISLQTKAIRTKLRVPGIGKYPRSSGKLSPTWSKSRRAQGGLGYSMSVKVKWGYISPRSSKPTVQKVFLFPIHCKPRPSRVSLECPGLANIPQVAGNRAEVGQNHDARKAVSATLRVLK